MGDGVTASVAGKIGGCPTFNLEEKGVPPEEKKQREPGSLECYTANASLGLAGALQLSETGSKLGLALDFPIAKEGGVGSDFTNLRPIQSLPTQGGTVQPSYKLELKLLGKERPAEGGLAGEIAREGEETKGGISFFKPGDFRLGVGRMPFKPANPFRPTAHKKKKDELVEFPIESPFAAIPVRLDQPAALAVVGGFTVHFWDGIALSADGGAGRGVKGPGTWDPDTWNLEGFGWSVLPSLKFTIWKDLAVGGAYEHTEQDAPVEPELNVFLEGPGNTLLDGGYGRVDAYGVSLFGGHLKRTVEQRADDPESSTGSTHVSTRRIREMNYVAVKVPLDPLRYLGEGFAIGLMYGWQVFTQRYFDSRGEDVDATGSLLSFGLGKSFPWGKDGAYKATLNATAFVQQAEAGDRSFSLTGGFGSLAISAEETILR